MLIIYIQNNIKA